MRPEDLRIASPEATGIPATVRVVESLGHEVLVLCRVEGVDGDVVVRMPSDSDRPAVGSAVRLVGDAGSVNLFDAASTQPIDPLPTPRPRPTRPRHPPERPNSRE